MALRHFHIDQVLKIDETFHNSLETLILISLQTKTLINYSDKAFKGTFVNRALSSLHGGSLEITLTVPLIASTTSLGLFCIQNIR